MLRKYSELKNVTNSSIFTSKAAFLLIFFSVLSTQAIASIDIYKVGYFRAPSIHENSIVIAAGVDLWRVEYKSVILAERVVTLITHSFGECWFS